MPHEERPKVRPKKMYCYECGFRIWDTRSAISFLDHDYHRRCLISVMAKMNLNLELARMGLDQPPLPAA